WSPPEASGTSATPTGRSPGNSRRPPPVPPTPRGTGTPLPGVPAGTPRRVAALFVASPPLNALRNRGVKSVPRNEGESPGGMQLQGAPQEHAVREVGPRRARWQEIPRLAPVPDESGAGHRASVVRSAGLELTDGASVRSWMARRDKDAAPVREGKANDLVAEWREHVPGL